MDKEIKPKPIQARPASRPALDPYDEEEDDGGKGLPIILALAVLLVLGYVFLSSYDQPDAGEQTKVTKVTEATQVDPKREMYKEKCQPDYFVKYERAADGLDKVTCMRANGTTHELIVEIE